MSHIMLVQVAVQPDLQREVHLIELGEERRCHGCIKRKNLPPLSPTSRTAQNWSTSGVGGEHEVEIHDGDDARVDDRLHLIYRHSRMGHYKYTKYQVFE